jgi:oligoendopeptidase F
MSERLPETVDEFMGLGWSEVEGHMSELAQGELRAGNLKGWLSDWSQLLSLIDETSARLRTAAAIDTRDEEAGRRFKEFREQIWTPAMDANQKLRMKLLSSGLTVPQGFEMSLRQMKADAHVFCEENLPLLNEEKALQNEYDTVLGAQTVTWEGEEMTVSQVAGKLGDPDRAVRERAWRLRAERQLADKETIGSIWQELLSLRQQMAHNAGFQDYRALRWEEMHRFDYTPQDCLEFHDAVERVAKPVVGRIYEGYRSQLGVDRLRPWDLDADPQARPPLKPFASVEELEERASAVFRNLDTQLGEYFEVMRKEKLLDLENRKHKAPHGWCATYPLVRRPFIFMNAVGTERNVITLLHEAGHAFHVFEMAGLPYYQQLDAPGEFCEVASMAMELLAAPYIVKSRGGFYSDEDGARARKKHLENAIAVSWPYCTAMDAFQHWVYMNPGEASLITNCDKKWGEIWLRFMPVVDWDGLEIALLNGWQSVPHFFGWPFYALEYSIARLGAVQIWRNARTDKRKALSQYRSALSLGGTASLPELFETAGARFALDAETLREAVSLIEETIVDLQ